MRVQEEVEVLPAAFHPSQTESPGLDAARLRSVRSLIGHA
jgi:hypothetical protein